jgi:hypothetical protein
MKLSLWKICSVSICVVLNRTPKVRGRGFNLSVSLYSNIFAFNASNLLCNIMPKVTRHMVPNSGEVFCQSGMRLLEGLFILLGMVKKQGSGSMCGLEAVLCVSPSQIYLTFAIRKSGQCLKP